VKERYTGEESAAMEKNWELDLKPPPVFHSRLDD
jgi:hypothetical protein